MPSRPGAEALAGPKTKHPGQIFRAESDTIGVVVQTLGGVRHIQRKAAPDAASGLTFGQTGALHPEVDSFPVHFFHHQHSAHPARRVSAACALHFGGEGHFFSGVGVLYLCKPRAGRFHDADAQHCAQKPDRLCVLQAGRLAGDGGRQAPQHQLRHLHFGGAGQDCRRQTSDPQTPLRRLRDDGSVEVIYTDRIYYINFVMQFRYGAGSEYKRFRLVVTRNGILSIEEMN